MENSLAVYYYDKHKPTIRHSNFTSKNLPKRKKTICPYINIHSRMTQNSQYLKTILNLTGKWINKMCYLHVVRNKKFMKY